MVTKRYLGRKVISCVVSSLVLSFLLVVIHGYAPFFIYFIYFIIGSIVVGIPCSIAIDLLVDKIKWKLSYLVGLALHLIVAAVIVFFVYSQNFNILVLSVYAAAAGLWLADNILRRTKPFNAKSAD